MVELSGMLSNLSRSLPSVQYLLGGISYLGGIAFCFAALLRFRDNVEKGQSGESNANMVVPFAFLAMGSALLFLPSMMDSLSTTLFGSSSSVLEYSGYKPYDIYGSMTILIETVGVIWFIRGCILIAHASDPEQGQKGSKGMGPKGLMFIIAGLFGINFHSTVQMMDSVMNYLLSITIVKA